MPKRNSKRMTDEGIKRMSKPQKGRVERFDSGVNGLCLRITHTCLKTWNVYFRLKGRNQRMMIGPWIYGGEPDADGNGGYGVAAARREAENIRAQARAGIDPRKAREMERAAEDEKQEREAERTFGAIAQDYINSELPSLKRGAETRSVLERELLPDWKDRPIDTIKKRDAREVTNRLIAAGTPAAAYRAHETMTRLFNWMIGKYDAEFLGFDFSPLTSLSPPVKKTPRQRTLDHDEIRRLWPIWEELSYPFGKTMMLLLLTGARRSEIAHLKWSEVDLEQKLLKVPSARMKGGQDHLVPLSGMATEIILSLPRLSGPYVFSSGDGETPINNFASAKRSIALRLAKQNGQEPMSDWRTHDLRRTMRSELSRLRVPEAVSERILDHTMRGIQRVYNVYEYLDERREALEAWAIELQSIVSPPPDNNVVPIRQAREA